MNEKLEAILTIIRRNPNEMFTIAYKNPNLQHYRGESVTVFSHQVISEIKRLVKNGNIVKSVDMVVCVPSDIEAITKEEVIT